MGKLWNFLKGLSKETYILLIVIGIIAFTWIKLVPYIDDKNYLNAIAKTEEIKNLRYQLSVKDSLIADIKKENKVLMREAFRLDQQYKNKRKEYEDSKIILVELKNRYSNLINNNDTLFDFKKFEEDFESHLKYKYMYNENN